MPAFACLAALAAIGSGDDQHQTPSEEPNEIVVTGERLSRTVRETASSVEVFTADMIEAQPGADRLDNVLDQIPNIQLGSGNLGPTIRGQDSTGALQDLPAFLGGNRSRVTLQIDGRAVGYNEFVAGVTPLWDVEQIEVFRSPQSTTQGGNSIAGAIFVSTKDPTFRPEARARAIAGDFDTRQLSAVVSGPLVGEEVALRIAGDLRRSRSFAQIRDGLEGADPNKNQYGLVRIKLLAKPQGVPASRLEVNYTHTESRTPQFEFVHEPFRKRRNLVGGPAIHANVEALTASADLEFGEVLDSLTTLSVGKSRFQRFSAPGLGETDSRITDASVESVWHWRPGQRFQLTGGIHHIRTKLDQSIDLTAVIGLGKFRDRQRSLGLFGEGIFWLSPKLSVIAGLRHQRDTQDRQGQLGPDSFAGKIDFDRGFHAWLPKLSIAYDFFPHLTAGILVQRAYNPGGIALNFDTGQQLAFDAERLWSYELFLRARLPNEGVRLDANLFFNDFRDAQRTETRALFLPGGPPAFWAIIHNVPKARSYGLEASIAWRASQRLQLSGGLGLLRTEIVDAGDFSGLEERQFQRSPKSTVSVAVEWKPVARLTVNAALRHNSGYFSTDLNDPARRIDGSTRVDARAAYEAGPVSLFGYVRNLFDEFHMAQLFTATQGQAGEPRQVGIGLEARF